jgi:hypothetical protein
MLYQMLTGEIPRGMWSMPSTKMGADPRFDAIIARAMQTDREMRYQTAHEVRTDLDRILTMPIVKAGGEGTMAIPKQVVRQQRPPTQGARQPQQRPSSGAAQQLQGPQKKKSAAGLFLGIGAVIVLGLGALFMLPGRQRQDAGTPPSDDKIESASSPASAAPVTATQAPETKKTSAPSPSSTRPGPRAPGTQAPQRIFGMAGRSYRLVLDPMSWREAKAKAESMGGHLVTISSKDEEEWIGKTFRPLLRSDNLVLTGGQRRGLGGSWEWLTGEAMNYKNSGPNWGDGGDTPNMFLALRINPSDTTWDDVNDTRKAPFIIEWDKFGTATPGSAAQKIVDLLSLVDVPRDAVRGQWTKSNDGVEVAKPNGGSLLDFNHPVPEEYDFIVEFTPKGEGNNVNQYLSAQGYNFTYKFNLGGASGMYGFDLLDGRSQENRAEAAGKGNRVLKSGQRYRSEIKVRKNGLRALVDGEEVVNWQGDFKRFSMETFVKLRDSSHVGIGSFNRGALFHRAELREVSPTKSAPTLSTTLASSGMPGSSSLGAVVSPPESTPMKAATPAVDPRLAQLEAGFRARHEADAQKPYLAAVAALNQSYINSGIARARATAQAGGNLDEVAALDAEKGLIERGQPLPATDFDGAPASLLQLRKTYREALAKHGADRDAKAAPLYGIYVKALEDYVVELTKANRIDEAQKVRQLRDEIAKNGVAKQEPLNTEAKPGSVLTLFDGKTLDGWKKAGDPAGFSVNAGTIRANGPKANMYYVGAGAKPPVWTDFDLTMKVKTDEKANSGLWIHTAGSGSAIAAALEVQIANGNRDLEKTGSIYAVKGVDLQHVKDDEWFDLRVVVKGRTITVFINDKQVNTWTQPTQWQPPDRVPNARLSEGTIGLQSNGGTVWFKDIQLTPG